MSQSGESLLISVFENMSPRQNCVSSRLTPSKLFQFLNFTLEVCSLKCPLLGDKGRPSVRHFITSSMFFTSVDFSCRKNRVAPSPTCFHCVCVCVCACVRACVYLYMRVYYSVVVVVFCFVFVSTVSTNESKQHKHIHFHTCHRFV